LEGKLLDRLGQTFKVEMPRAETLDGYLDRLLPIVKPWSEDLREEKFYLYRPWMEKKDDDRFHKTVLHFFHPDGEYLKSVDGDVSAGTWRYLGGANKFLIADQGSDGELYDLAFLDGQFFILKKHGDQARLGQRKYFVLVVESLGKYEWRDLMEMLFRKSQSNISFYVLIAIAVVIVLVMLILFR
jgi:hypothetical protein